MPAWPHRPTMNSPLWQLCWKAVALAASPVIAELCLMVPVGSVQSIAIVWTPSEEAPLIPCAKRVLGQVMWGRSRNRGPLGVFGAVAILRSVAWKPSPGGKDCGIPTGSRRESKPLAASLASQGRRMHVRVGKRPAFRSTRRADQNVRQLAESSAWHACCNHSVACALSLTREPFCSSTLNLRRHWPIFRARCGIRECGPCDARRGFTSAC